MADNRHELPETPPDTGEVIIDLQDGKLYDSTGDDPREIDLPQD